MQHGCNQNQIIRCRLQFLEFKFQNLNLQVAHLASEALDVPDDQLAISCTGGDGVHTPLSAGVNPQLRYLEFLIQIILIVK